MDFVVVVEIPQGSRNKYEMDHGLGRIRLDRMLFTSTRYPADYGYVEGTVGLDGEPLDALVLGGDPTFPGVLIRCRALGMFRMNDQRGEDDKVLCAPATDPRMEHLHELDDMHRGTGHCGHCQLGPLLLCRDGPVVSYAEAAPLVTIKEL